MQEIDNILSVIIFFTLLFLILSGLIIIIIFRNQKIKETHTKAIFESIYLTQEEERSKIAMDLHDDLGSNLIGIKLNLENLIHSNDIQALKNCISSSLSYLSDAIQTTRLTSQTLMPQTIKIYGLANAINDLVKRYKNSITINLICDIEDRFSQIIEINIYRIISELISNTIKHASANKIDLYIQKEGSILYISFVDDGVGFDFTSMVKTSSGLGVNNIVNRVAFLNGTIQYIKDSGSTFTIFIPIN